MENRRFIDNLPLIDIDWGEITNEHGDFWRWFGSWKNGILAAMSWLESAIQVAKPCPSSMAWCPLFFASVSGKSQLLGSTACCLPHLPLRIISWSDAQINSNQHRPVQSGHVYRRRLDFPVFPHAVAQSLGRKGEWKFLTDAEFEKLKARSQSIWVTRAEQEAVMIIHLMPSEDIILISFWNKCLTLKLSMVHETEAYEWRLWRSLLGHGPRQIIGF